MKKLLALLLSALLTLSGLSVLAEGSYIGWEIAEDLYEHYITEEAYPEVRLALTSASGMYGPHNYAEPLFLCFPKPEGARLLAFSTYDCRLYDETTRTQYDYSINDYTTIESFLEYPSESDSYVILEDGSNGYAMYVYPSSYSCFGRILLPVPQLGEDAMLTLGMDFSFPYDDPIDEDESVEYMKQAMGAELQRIDQTARTQRFDTMWTVDETPVAGVELATSDGSITMRSTLPSLEANTANGAETVSPILTSVNSNRFTTLIVAGEGTADADVEIGTYTYVDYMMENEPENVHTVTLADGNEYRLYYPGGRDNITIVYVDRVIGTQEGYDSTENVYLTLNLMGWGLGWSSEEDLVDTLNSWVTGISVNGEAVNTVAATEPVETEPEPAETETEPAGGFLLPGAKNDGETENDETKEGTSSVFGGFLLPGASKGDSAESAPEAPAATDEGWVCPDCGAENSGNFCTSCGAARPAEATSWVCPECGLENDVMFKFCPGCGTAAPAADAAGTAATAADPASLVGDWLLTGVPSLGEVPAGYTLESLGLYMLFTFNADGTMSLDMSAQDETLGADGVWEVDGDTIIMTMETDAPESMLFALEGDTLTLYDFPEAGDLVFTRQ